MFVPALALLAALSAPHAVTDVVPAPGPFTDGTYLVGSDIAAGQYRTTGPDASEPVPMCFWSRNKDTDGQLSSIIANGIVKGPGIVSVKKGDNNVEFSGGCTWTKAGG
jgi:hypothetical protein